jgi:hypothetical protein
MRVYFRVWVEILQEMFTLFYVLVNFKFKLTFWKQTTETLLFESFIKDEHSRLFIECYFPKLYKKFIYLHNFSLTLSDRNDF